MSTGAGIPDFRSKGGLYDTHGDDLFHASTLVENPQKILDFANEFAQQTYKPTNAHAVMKKFQDQLRLQAVLTQNIDGLESDSGVDSSYIYDLHGSLQRYRCTQERLCGARYTRDEFLVLTAAAGGSVAACCDCECGIVRPDIVLFGESLNVGMLSECVKHLRACDAVVCVGTSLRVNPVASLPRYVAPSAVKVWINRDAPPDAFADFFTHQLIMDCDAGMEKL